MSTMQLCRLGHTLLFYRRFIMQYPKPDPIRAVPAKYVVVRALVLCVAALCVSGCASARTPGEQFRKIMADLDKECRKDHLGPYQTSPPGNGVRDSSCDILFLKPQDPLATPEGRFAHSIQLPPPYDKPKDVYKSGMTSVEYFKALCEAEAGEFIFKTVRDIEGIVQLRPHDPYPGAYTDLVFQTREMRLDNHETEYGKSFVRPGGGPKYKYVEIKLSDSEEKQFKHPYLMYSIKRQEHKYDKAINSQDGNNMSILSEGIDVPRGRYGFTSRGIRRIDDLEHGIQGSELIVLDRETTEVLGYQRVFRQLYFDKRDLDPRIVSARACGQRSRWINDFVREILQPSN